MLSVGSRPAFGAAWSYRHTTTTVLQHAQPSFRTLPDCPQSATYERAKYVARRVSCATSF